MFPSTEVTAIDVEDSLDNPLENSATIDTLEIDQLTNFVANIEALVQGASDAPEVLWTLIKSLPKVGTKIGATLTLTRILKYLIDSSKKQNSDLMIPVILQGIHIGH